MRQIVSGVYLIEGVSGAHIYLLTSEEGIMLVDSGGSDQADQIVVQLEERGYNLSDLRAIVLTHSHSDHTGSVAELARRSGAQVLAHQDEVLYIEQKASLPAGSLLRRLLGWLGDRVLKTTPCKVDKTLQDGDVVEALGGLQVIHAPGHTPGSIVLYQPERRILFCGDVLFNGNPLTGKGGVRFPPRIFSVDTAQAQESARKLADLSIEVVCFGHGEPLLERAEERVRKTVS